MNGKTQSILLAGAVCGIVALVASIVPIVGACLCCLVFIGAGAMAIWHYSNSRGDDAFMTNGEGAGMGALAGLVAGIVFGIALSIVTFFMYSDGVPPEVLDEMTTALDQFDLDMSEDEIEEMILYMTSATTYIVIGLLSSVVGTLLGAIGGLIGVSMFAKKDIG